MKKRTCNKTAALCGLILLAISSAVLGGCGKSEILAPDAKTVLIGGMDRGINYDLLVAFIRKHKEFQFICAYASGKRIFGEVGDCENCVYAEDLEQAVEAAVQMTEPGGACILSPAAASYGYFKNFEERGETFQKYVHAFAQ